MALAVKRRRIGGGGPDGSAKRHKVIELSEPVSPTETEPGGIVVLPHIVDLRRSTREEDGTGKADDIGSIAQPPTPLIPTPSTPRSRIRQRSPFVPDLPGPYSRFPLAPPIGEGKNVDNGGIDNDGDGLPDNPPGNIDPDPNPNSHEKQPENEDPPVGSGDPEIPPAPLPSPQPPPPSPPPPSTSSSTVFQPPPTPSPSSSSHDFPPPPRGNQLCRGSVCPPFPNRHRFSPIPRPKKLPPDWKGYPHRNNGEDCTWLDIKFDKFGCGDNNFHNNGTDHQNDHPGPLEMDLNPGFKGFGKSKGLFVTVVVCMVVIGIGLLLTIFWGIRKFNRRRRRRRRGRECGLKGGSSGSDGGSDSVDVEGAAVPAIVEKEKRRRWKGIPMPRRKLSEKDTPICTCIRGGAASVSGVLNIPVSGAAPGPIGIRDPLSLSTTTTLATANSNPEHLAALPRPLSASSYTLPPPLHLRPSSTINHSPTLAQQLARSQLRRSLSLVSSASSSVISSAPPSYTSPAPGVNPFTSRSNSTRSTAAASATSHTTDDTVVRSKREYRRQVDRLAEEGMYTAEGDGGFVADGFRCGPPNPFEDPIPGVMGGAGVGVSGLGPVDREGRPTPPRQPPPQPILANPFNDPMGAQNPFADEFGLPPPAEVPVEVGDGFGGYVPGGMRMVGSTEGGEGGRGGRMQRPKSVQEGGDRSSIVPSVVSGVSSSESTLRGDLEDDDDDDREDSIQRRRDRWNG